MATTPFSINPELTAIAIAFQNPDSVLIADSVLPRTPVSKKFSWTKTDVAQGFTVPDTAVGRKSAPNQVDLKSTSQSAECVDYALDDAVPNADIQADNMGVDPLGKAVMGIANYLKLSREVRVAGMVFNTANYAANQTATLAGNDQWSNAASDPIAAIKDYFDSMLIRPNIGILGQTTWSKISRHPKIVQAIYKTNQGAGVVTRQAFAELFELQELYVGSSFVNIKAPGQNPTFNRVWGNHAAFLYRDRVAGTQTGVTFGFTGQFGEVIAGSMEDRDVGMRGGIRVRVGESLKEIICSPECGFYFQNAVAA
ncbi:MAG: phage capsid protein [Candidatus Pacebacteria bacterium]|nr:phage capsid protein [Candidatus Paceibacterota bacterium]